VTIATTDTIPPTAPTNLVANSPNSSVVNLTWTASSDTGGSGLASYLLERCAGSTCTDFTQFATATAPSSADPNIAGATTYRYRVRARDGSGNNGDYSNVASVTTPARTPPTVPGSFQATAVDMTRVQVTWTESSATDGSGISLYLIERCTGAGCGNFSQIGSVLPNTGEFPSPNHSYTDSTVSGWTTYRYRMRARDGSGTYSDYTAIDDTTTPDLTNPLSPSGLVASPVSSTQVSLTWTAASDSGGSGLASYRIERCLASSCSFAEIGSSTGNSYADNTVSGTTAYQYRVRARDGAGNNSGYSNTASATTTDTIAPTTPTNLSASAPGSGTVNLSWSASSDSGGSGLTGYRIYRGGSHIATTTATSYSDTSVVASATYSYNVAAFDNAGNASGQSSTATVTTTAALQATLNRTTWSWFYQLGQAVQVSPNVVATATGGSGGYTYMWEWVSGDTQTSVVNPTSNSTNWSRTVPSYFVDYTSVWRCRVIDSSGGVTYTPNVTVTFSKADYS
jgi:fibronectin type 3 domain-containing protein